ncbi:MAG: ATP-binding protein [Oscillospiraceae bacterium]|nr:ATP-binding protein [Oscillospiraceae bacterium]
MDNKFTMSINLNVLNHLGLNLYSNIPAVLSEIVANSWDADADNVKIKIENNEIRISDDGSGMTLEDINDKFLTIGYPKRECGEIKTLKYSRPVMGRKGIGKLSMFSIAKNIQIITRKNDIINGFEMDVNEIINTIKDKNENYHPKEIIVEEDKLSSNGTKIILKNLKKGISKMTSDYIKKRIARRFSIIGNEYNFSVFVDKKEISIEDRDYFSRLNYIWYYGDKSKKYCDYASKQQHSEIRENEITLENKKYLISGWIGTVNTSGDHSPWKTKAKNSEAWGRVPFKD